MAEALFWTSTALIFYAYFGYPLLVLLWPRVKPVARKTYRPSISIVLAACDEQDHIDEKIQHLLSVPYPENQREIIVVSDGSTDATAERLLAWNRHPGIRTFHYDDHRGKAVAIQLGVSQAVNEIVIFMDVRQRLDHQALHYLLDNFADSEVGCVSGELRFTTERKPELRTTLYWKYERRLRRQESVIGSCMGATGAFYAIRRELFEPLPEGLLLDDVYTPLQIALRGRRVVHEPQAIVYDTESKGERQEFQRKVRTITGTYQLLRYLPGLRSLSIIGIQFFSHKLIRLLVPVFLVISAISNCFLSGPFYRFVLLAQVVFYVTAGLGALLPKNAPGLIGIPRAFVLLNGAALVAMVNFLAGRSPAWKK